VLDLFRRFRYQLFSSVAVKKVEKEDTNMAGPTLGYSSYTNILLAAGFFLSMIIMEVLTEGTFNQYKDAGSVLPAAITFFQFLSCFAFPLVINPDTLYTMPTTPKTIFPYFILSILVFGATALATTAVNFVPYSVKIVFKSTKLIPTMIVSSCMHNVAYSWREYLAAFFLCLGAVGYGYDPGKSSIVQNQDYSHLGILILTISAFCDALVPNIQQDMMKLHNISAETLMVNTNVVGFVCATIYMCISGDFISLISMVRQTPYLLVNLTAIGCSLAIAVICYTSLIKKAGSVFAVSVGTIRKIVTIALSYLLFPKELLPIHILSSLCVALGIILEGSKGSKSQGPASKATKDAKLMQLVKDNKGSSANIVSDYESAGNRTSSV
jgi:adenosine 3'-phospho 5'-phosphosulfate transporter B3